MSGLARLAVELEENMRHGILPGAGGYLDQDSGLIILIGIAKSARSDRERINSIKRNRMKDRKW